MKKSIASLMSLALVWWGTQSDTSNTLHDTCVCVCICVSTCVYVCVCVLNIDGAFSNQEPQIPRQYMAFAKQYISLWNFKCKSVSQLSFSSYKKNPAQQSNKHKHPNFTLHQEAQAQDCSGILSSLHEVRTPSLLLQNQHSSQLESN